VFDGCYNLESLDINFNSTIKADNDITLQSCHKLKTVTCPATFLSYVQWAPNISNLVINGSTEIADGAFCGHSGLKQLTIGEHVK
jgi:hypothetical protein